MDEPLNPIIRHTLQRLRRENAAAANHVWSAHMRGEFPGMTDPQFQQFLNRGPVEVTEELWLMALEALWAALHPEE